MIWVLIVIALVLLWIAGAIYKINQNFVKWANADIKERKLGARK